MTSKFSSISLGERIRGCFGCGRHLNLSKRIISQIIQLRLDLKIEKPNHPLTFITLV